MNITGTVKEIDKRHRFERANGSKGTFASFLLEDSIGIFRVVIWNDEVRVRVFNDKNFRRNNTVEIINGYIREGYKGKVEIHIGKYGNIIVQEKMFSPIRRLGTERYESKSTSRKQKRVLSKVEIMERFIKLGIDATKVSKTPCHHCGLLCSSSAKKCPKCGEPLAFNF